MKNAPKIKKVLEDDLMPKDEDIELLPIGDISDQNWEDIAEEIKMERNYN